MADPPRKPANPFATLAALRETLAPGPSPTVVTTPVAAVVDPIAALWSRRVVVGHERKGRGGKTVTLARFPDGADATALDALAREIRKALGTAAHVEGDAVVVQGDLVDRVTAWLGTQGATRIVRGTA